MCRNVQEYAFEPLSFVRLTIIYQTRQLVMTLLRSVRILWHTEHTVHNTK